MPITANNDVAAERRLPPVTVEGFRAIEVFRGECGYVFANIAKTVNDGPVIYTIPYGSVGIPAAEATAQSIGSAIQDIVSFDDSHGGLVTDVLTDEAWDDLKYRLSGKRRGLWKLCTVRRAWWGDPKPWIAECDVVSLRWSGDVDSRLNDVGTVVCPCGAGVEELGGMVLESYARVDAWCARNGRNPYTGMPCPLREDLGGDGVLVLTPPAYFQEDYAPAPGVVRGYYHHVDAMALPQEPGSRWYGGWVRGLDAWLCWRVVPAGGVDGLLGVWQAAHGRAVEVSSVGCEGEPGAGCFSSRGVVSNRSWASYWFRRELASGSVLELVLDVKQPGRRKRLAGKAVKAWERCARHTQLLPPDGAAGTQA